ncbi:MAG: putative glycosyltransferase [Pseudonocardiales bacterium]|nr:putative glycosyltransferase [Pseudonocardiales bacterium]
MIRRIAVVVPAHDEEDLLAECVRALAHAAAGVDVPVDLVIVLDACTDGSPLVAGELDEPAFASVQVVTIKARNVGAARRAGFARALRGRSSQDLWLATTDADSTVPADWFTRQLSHRARGSDAVIGTVVVNDWTGCSDTVRTRYLRSYRGPDGHRHIHGANLSFSAEAYIASGGFQALPTDEDVRFVEDLTANGRSLRWAGDLAVSTSCRLKGRAPAGFAGHLVALA